MLTSSIETIPTDSLLALEQELSGAQPRQQPLKYFKTFHTKLEVLERIEENMMSFKKVLKSIIYGRHGVKT